MALQLEILCVVLVLLVSGLYVRCDDDDDDVKGPLMSVKSDGGLYNTAEIINQHKRKGESHIVTTEDGYKLTVFRIVPAKLPAPVVLLQHGYTASSDCWVTDPDSLAFKLSDAGFDVWLGNIRGNAYAKSHAKMKPEEKDFWNFSFHEMGTKDMPAVVDYVLTTTKQTQLHYIGHSMGTMMSYIMTSTKPEYNAKLKSLLGLAPLSSLSKMVEMLGPDGMAEDMAKTYMKQFRESGKVEVFPRKDQPVNKDIQITCNDIEENYRDMCVEKMESAQKVLGGAYLPAGSSFKTMDHFYQMAVTGLMKYYKFGTAEENKKAYGSEDPPLYSDKFKQITVPTLLWSTSADQLVQEKDVDDLKASLANVVQDNRIKEPECFDHIAFLFPSKKSCIPARVKLYDAIVEAIKKLDTK